MPLIENDFICLIVKNNSFEKHIFLKGLWVLLALLFVGCAEDNQALDPVLEKIKQNTFILVPINTYAQNIPKEKAIEFVKTNCHLKHLPPAEVLNCKALSECDGTNCIREFESHGTAFLMNSGKTLHTAWHVLYPTHAAALFFFRPYFLSLNADQKKELSPQLKPKFVLLNHNHDIVYDTRKNPTSYAVIGDPLSPTHIFYGQIHDQSYGYFENIPFDFASINLSKKLGEGLKAAESTVLNGEFLASGFGYDGRHFKFDISKGKRESLTKLKIKTNEFIDFQLAPFDMPIETFLSLTTFDKLIYMGYSETEASAQIQKHGLELVDTSIKTVLKSHGRHMRDLATEKNEKVIFTNNPVLPGQSGGPLTNTKGEVIGILTNAFMTQLKPGEYVSFGAGAYLFNSFDEN